MTAHGLNRLRRVVRATLAFVGVFAVHACTDASAPSQTVAEASTHASAPTSPIPSSPIATKPVPVAYKCFVTYPGGSSVVDLLYKFQAGGISDQTADRLTRVTIMPPVITPDPRFNVSVKSLKMVFRLPKNSTVNTLQTEGGSGLGKAGATVDKHDGLVDLKAAGPFLANVPFQLPTLNIAFTTPGNDDVEVTTGGTSFAEPSFSWTLTNHGNEQRPLACNPQAPVIFTHTTVR